MMPEPNLGNAPFPMTRADKIQVAIAIALTTAALIVMGLTVWATIHFAVKYW